MATSRRHLFRRARSALVVCWLGVGDCCTAVEIASYPRAGRPVASDFLGLYSSEDAAKDTLSWVASWPRYDPRLPRWSRELLEPTGERARRRCLAARHPGARRCHERRRCSRKGLRKRRSKRHGFVEGRRDARRTGRRLHVACAVAGCGGRLRHTRLRRRLHDYRHHCAHPRRGLRLQMVLVVRRSRSALVGAAHRDCGEHLERQHRWRKQRQPEGRGPHPGRSRRSERSTRNTPTTSGTPTGVCGLRPVRLPGRSSSILTAFRSTRPS
jgi:hypothetical protein